MRSYYFEANFSTFIRKHFTISICEEYIYYSFLNVGRPLCLNCRGAKENLPLDIRFFLNYKGSLKEGLVYYALTNGVSFSYL